MAAAELPAAKDYHPYLLGLFAAIDLAYIVDGFCGTDKFPIEVQHLQRIALPQTDSIQPLKNNVSHDTIR